MKPTILFSILTITILISTTTAGIRTMFSRSKSKKSKVKETDATRVAQPTIIMSSIPNGRFDVMENYWKSINESSLLPQNNASDVQYNFDTVSEISKSPSEMWIPSTGGSQLGFGQPLQNRNYYLRERTRQPQSYPVRNLGSAQSFRNVPNFPTRNLNSFQNFRNLDSTQGTNLEIPTGYSKQLLQIEASPSIDYKNSIYCDCGRDDKLFLVEHLQDPA